VCVSAVYDKNRTYSGSLLRQRATRRHCPLQGYKTYVQTSDISNTEFLAILRYWGHLDVDTAIDSNGILARFDHPAYRKEFERLLRHLDDDLRVRKPEITFIIGGYKSDDFDLSAEEREFRSYQVGVGAYDIYLVATPTGFRIYGVNHPIP